MKRSFFLVVIFIGVVSVCCAQDGEKVLFERAFQETDICSSAIKLQEAIDTCPQSVYSQEALWMIAENSYLKGDFKKAQKEFEKYLEKYPREKKAGFAWSRIGYCFLMQGEYDNASQAFRRSLLLDPWSEESILAKKGAADVFFAEGNFKKALAEYKKISGPDILNANILYRISLCWLNIRNTKEFTRIKSEVLKKYPLSIEASLLKKIDILKTEESASAETIQSMPINSSGNTVTVKKWAVQVGSFTKEENARNFSRVLLKKKYFSWVEQVKIGNGIFYRVFIGKFNTEEEAKKKAEEIKSKEDLPTRITEVG